MEMAWKWPDTDNLTSPMLVDMPNSHPPAEPFIQPQLPSLPSVEPLGSLAEPSYGLGFHSKPTPSKIEIKVQLVPEYGALRQGNSLLGLQPCYSVQPSPQYTARIRHP